MASRAGDPITHVIVLMFENRSFAHMLGALPGVEGVDPANLRSRSGIPRSAGTALPSAVYVAHRLAGERARRRSKSPCATRSVDGTECSSAVAPGLYATARRQDSRASRAQGRTIVADAERTRDSGDVARQRVENFLAQQRRPRKRKTAGGAPKGGRKRTLTRPSAAKRRLRKSGPPKKSSK